MYENSYLGWGHFRKEFLNLLKLSTSVAVYASFQVHASKMQLGLTSLTRGSMLSGTKNSNLGMTVLFTRHGVQYKTLFPFWPFPTTQLFHCRHNKATKHPSLSCTIVPHSHYLKRSIYQRLTTPTPILDWRKEYIYRTLSLTVHRTQSILCHVMYRVPSSRQKRKMNVRTMEV